MIQKFFNKIAGSNDQSKESTPKSRLVDSLAKTGRGIAQRLPLLGKYFRIDDDTLSRIEETLLSADIGVALTEELIEHLKTIDKKESANLKDILKEQLLTLIRQNQPVAIPQIKPYVILIVGVNGTGKTTTIGKLAAMYRRENKKTLIAAADTFRAAAYEQLEIWAKRSGAEFMGNPQGKDPSAIVFDAAKSAIAHNADVLLIDTAGRLHTKSNLMDELAKVKRTIGKIIPTAPHDIWLVLDAGTGQNGIVQVQEFAKAVGVTGLILTKLDGTAKGGVALAIHHQTNLPIRYIGIGEKIDDLVEFNAEEFVSALLDAGSSTNEE